VQFPSAPNESGKGTNIGDMRLNNALKRKNGRSTFETQLVFDEKAQVSLL
jgi:hypothetical protein